MQNLYTPSKILSEVEFKKIEEAFEKAWSKDSTYLGIRDKWSDENKAFGQCLITTLIINDLFGGKMAFDKPSSHYWNLLPDGTEQDFTRSQFKEDIEFHTTRYKIRKEMLYDENGIKKNTEERYKLLKRNFLKYYKPDNTTLP